MWDNGAALTSSKERVSLPPRVEKYLISWAMFAVSVDILHLAKTDTPFFPITAQQTVGRESFHDIT